MEKQFVTYEIALKLKELGFDEKCFGFWYVSQINNSCIELRHGMCIFKSTSIELSKYPKNVLAPLWQQVWSFLDDNGVIIGIIFVDNVFKYTLNIENYVSNEFKDRMSVIKSATEYATNYLWDKKFNK